MSKKPLLQIGVLQLCVGTGLLLAAGFTLAEGGVVTLTATEIEIPDRNSVAQATEGETVLAKVRVFTFSGIRLLSPIHGNQPDGRQAGRPTVDIDPQYLFARTEDKNGTHYTGYVRYRYGGVTDVTGRSMLRRHKQESMVSAYERMIQNK